MAGVEAVTADVVIGNVALLPPGAIETLDGTVAAVVLLTRLITTALTKDVETGVLSVTFPMLEPPPVTLTGETERANGGCMTANFEKLLTLPLTTLTIPGPVVDPAVKRPALLIVAPGTIGFVSDQVKTGCGESLLPNWSSAVAVNCCVVLTSTTG